MGNKRFFSLASIKAQQSSKGGNITRVTSDEMPGLVNLSFSLLKLTQNGFQEPIWHPNANKIGYCLQGEALVTIRTPTENEVFMINKGDVFFIPKGFVHTITNTGKPETIIAFGLNHTKPEELFLSQAIYSLSDSVFSTTFNTSSEFYNGLKKNKKDELIRTLVSNNGTHPSNNNRFKFDIETSTKIINTKGGYVQSALKHNLDTLDGLGILGFGLKPKGIVEPHWHTNAGELIYIITGRTRVTVLGPDGTLDALEVKGGEGAFAPASYFHSIENIGNDDVEVAAFFSDAQPDFIGVGEVVGSYSNEVLASIFNVSPDYFKNLKKTEEPLVIVPV